MHGAELHHRETRPDPAVQVQRDSGLGGDFFLSSSPVLVGLIVIFGCCAVLQVWTKKTSSCPPAPPFQAGAALATAQQVRCKSSAAPAASRGPVSRRWCEGQQTWLSLLFIFWFLVVVALEKAAAVGLLCRGTWQRTKSSGSAGDFSFPVFSLGQCGACRGRAVNVSADGRTQEVANQQQTEADL